MTTIPNDLKTRKRLARESTDKHVLEVLARDERATIRREVLKNEHVGTGALLTLWMDASFRGRMLSETRINTNLTPAFLAFAATHAYSDHFHPTAIAKNPNTPVSILLLYVTSDHYLVSENALKNLRGRRVLPKTATEDEERAAHLLIDEACRDGRRFATVAALHQAAKTFVEQGGGGIGALMGLVSAENPNQLVLTPTWKGRKKRSPRFYVRKKVRKIEADAMATMPLEKFLEDENLARFLAPRIRPTQRYVTDTKKWAYFEDGTWTLSSMSNHDETFLRFFKDTFYHLRDVHHYPIREIDMLLYGDKTESVVKAARGRLSITSDAFDADPYLWRDGDFVIDLRTGSQRKVRADDYFVSDEQSRPFVLIYPPRMTRVISTYVLPGVSPDDPDLLVGSNMGIEQTLMLNICFALIQQELSEVERRKNPGSAE
jgi:hypothetical protein